MNFSPPSLSLREAVALRLAPLRARYEALQPREQQLVAVAAIVLSLFFLQAGVWKPAAAARSRAAAQLETARSVASSLAVTAAEVAAHGPQAGAQIVGSDVSLLSAVDQATKNGMLSKPPSRLQPDGENQARVWFEDVQFDVLLGWMSDLQSRYGVKIDVADIERQPTPGLVNARLSVTRSR
jgi:general secretion pathway protein M